MKRIGKKKDGYVLTWILVFFLIVAMLSVTTVSFALLSTQSTYIQHNRRQAQYTAKSAVMSTVKYISKNTTNIATVEDLMQNAGTGSFPGMGDYSVEVAYESPSKERIKVTATGSYKGQSYTTSAYLIKPPSLGGLIPTDNVIYVNNPLNKQNPEGIGQTRIAGNVYLNGDFILAQGSKISGHLVINGEGRLSGGAGATENVFCFKNLIIEAGFKVARDVRTLGNLTADGGTEINGDVYADGSLTMNKPAGSAKIQGDALIGGSVDFDGLDDGERVGGVLKYAGSAHVPKGKNLKKFASRNEKINSYIPIDPASYTPPQTLPIFMPPSQSEMPELYISLPEPSSENLVVSSSGTITDSFMQPLKAWPVSYGSTLIFDATDKDIYLRLHDTHMNIGNGINIEVKTNGVHNVYIYLSGDSSIRIAGNQYMGMHGNRAADPHLFIFADGEQRIELVSNSGLNACVYMPNGNLHVAGSMLAGIEKVIGLCIVGETNIDSNVTFRYAKPPSLEDTDLDSLQAGSWSSSSPWAIGSWGE